MNKKLGPGHANSTNDNEKLDRILIRLKVDRHRLAREPQIMEIIDNAAMGGRQKVLIAMRLSTDPIVQEFLDHHDNLPPSYQKIVPWEAIALIAGVGVRQLLGGIILALRQHSTAGVKIAALSAHTEITKATIANAMVPGQEGFRDRQMVHQALGFLAPPKGQTINFNFDRAKADGVEEVEPEDIDMNDMFPDLTTTQSKSKLTE
jgi:hypothetical protein